MKTRILLWSLMATVSLSSGQSPAPIPVVIELFTSEGCSSCPPADRLLSVLDQKQPVPGVQLIVLSEHVDYWNSDGWSDPYSSREFSERQRRYTELLKVPDPYTPQAVIDGRYEVVGNNAPKLEAAIQQAQREKKVPLRLQLSQTEKGIHAELRSDQNAPKGAEVYFAIAEDSVVSKVSAGENGGHMLTHTAVVRSLTKGGKLAAGDSGITIDLKIKANWGKHLRVIAFLADHDSGKILGATMAEASTASALPPNS
jgi:hypothetical protein